MDQNAMYLGPDGEVVEVKVRERLIDEAVFSTIEAELNEIWKDIPQLTEVQSQATTLGYQGPAHLSTTEHEAAKREVETIFSSTLSKKEKAEAIAYMDLAFITSFLELQTNEINAIKKKITNLYSNKETKQ